MHYVVCLAFDENMDHLVLMTKRTGPPCVVGMDNGPGGKVEDGEEPLDAARREFLEETGVSIQEWRFFCTLRDPRQDYSVHFYWCRSDDVMDCRTTTNEPVFFVSAQELSTTNVMPNLRWMVPFLRDQSLVEHSLGELECHR